MFFCLSRCSGNRNAVFHLAFQTSLERLYSGRCIAQLGWGIAQFGFCESPVCSGTYLKTVGV